MASWIKCLPYKYEEPNSEYQYPCNRWMWWYRFLIPFVRAWRHMDPCDSLTSHSSWEHQTQNPHRHPNFKPFQTSVIYNVRALWEFETIVICYCYAIQKESLPYAYVDWEKNILKSQKSVKKCSSLNGEIMGSFTPLFCTFCHFLNYLQ